ncbi:hypothetical protein M083_1123 [Bacteroides fragilis str. 3986 T(B)9]|nr:hypothetical protein M083_1123 [Bacteroides fragilis str. 3986 T(B)9]
MENSYNIVLDAFTNIFNWYSSKGCIQLEIFYTGCFAFEIKKRPKIIDKLKIIVDIEGNPTFLYSKGSTKIGAYNSPGMVK